MRKKIDRERRVFSKRSVKWGRVTITFGARPRWVKRNEEVLVTLFPKGDDASEMVYAHPKSKPYTYFRINCKRLVSTYIDTGRKELLNEIIIIFKELFEDHNPKYWAIGIIKALGVLEKPDELMNIWTIDLIPWDEIEVPSTWDNK